MGSKARGRKKQKAARSGAGGLRAEAITASRWPVMGAWVTPGWKARGSAGVVLARQHPYDGRVAVACFYVDLWCMGVKTLRFDTDIDLDELLDHFAGGGPPLEPCAPELVAAIVEAGAAYAESLGLPQAKDLPAVREMLRGLDPSKVEPVETGRDGKPMYVSGPNDNVAVILAHLERKLGPEGFRSIFRVDEAPDK